MACFRNKTKTIMALLKKGQEDLDKQALKDWINMKTTQDKFCAIHYASFRGNIHVIKELLELGANMQVKNAYGLNCMHIAAQGNEPISLYYFKQLGLSLISRDKRGSTPLHWACF